MPILATEHDLASLLQLALGSAGAAPNRLSVEGLAAHTTADGALELAIATLEAASLRLQGPVDLARLRGLSTAGGAWQLAPLATAEGTLQAKIVDAHLSFDAHVTVPIRAGGIDFNKATVEHVGPDSRMGVSKMGLYVDAPNGRSYLYQFPATPVAGVEYEHRGALLGPWAVTERGKLHLQEFVESMLAQPPAAGGPGFTQQARLLLDRTAASGFVLLGDGPFALPGVRGELAGRGAQRNVVRVFSEAVGRGVSLEIASLGVRHLSLDAGMARIECDELAASLTLRVLIEHGQVRFEFDLSSVKATALRLRMAGA